MSKILTHLSGLWAWLNGDLAYHRYLIHHQHAHPGGEPQSRQAFYLETIKRRYDGVNRCC